MLNPSHSPFALSVGAPAPKSKGEFAMESPSTPPLRSYAQGERTLVEVATFEELVKALSKAEPSFVTLPSNAIFYMGLEHICAMLELASKQGISNVYEKFILDIQDDAGLCLRAFRTNIQNFLFNGPPETFKKLHSIAQSQRKVINYKG